MNSKVVYLSSTNFISNNILFLLRSLPSNRMQTPRESESNLSRLLRTASIFDSSDSSPFPIFPLPFVRSPIKKPTPDHVRITISFVRPNERERPLDDRITRVYLCIQSMFHFVGPPIFFLFTLFSSPLPHSLTISRTRDRSLGGRRNVGCYSRKILWVRYRRLR